MCRIYSKPLCFLHVNERMYNVVTPCKKYTLFVYISCKGKREVHPRTGHEGQKEAISCSATLSLSSALDVDGWSATHSGHFIPWGRPSNHCIGGWVCPTAGLDGCGKSRPPTGIRSPDRPARCESLY